MFVLWNMLRPQSSLWILVNRVIFNGSILFSGSIKFKADIHSAGYRKLIFPVFVHFFVRRSLLDQQLYWQPFSRGTALWLRNEYAYRHDYERECTSFPPKPNWYIKFAIKPSQSAYGICYTLSNVNISYNHFKARNNAEHGISSAIFIFSFGQKYFNTKSPDLRVFTNYFVALAYSKAQTHRM